MFILKKDRPLGSPEEWERGWKSYQAYLVGNRTLMPQSAYEFATAEWHYDFRDHKCPHDSWLERAEFSEIATGDRKQIRIIELKILLLGAYHDGVIELRYSRVNGYSTNAKANHHGDWLYDEVRTGESGMVIHEIEFENGHWWIECGDIHYKWVPYVQRT